MSEAFQPQLDFEAVDNAVEDGEALVVDLEGYEGPLHVLLALARTQKVDLLKLSITKLAEQYLKFVQEARRRRFSLAADYLVMASWLAYLKSRLLLPKPERKQGEEPPAEEMAAALAFRLMKLEAMRKAVDELKARPQLGRDVFTRGDPEAMVVIPSSRVEATLYELMQAYVTQRVRESQRTYNPGQRVEAYQLDDARKRLRTMLPRMESWTTLKSVAPEPEEDEADGPTPASYLASTFAATLELAKERTIEVKQLEAFADLYLRRIERPAEPLELTP
ncbi:ScpA family protein [Caulobacter sp. 17J65-9]|uniref:segregation/condensation protein A n=1 Tax=Caulobacter sp. 17J65-9 TaxID=2709382 RepID=UPI0013C9B6DA|nr:segregation/condensation protein A [Caulobacter sp. 17J65-9]